MVYTKVTTVECQTEFGDLGKRHCFLFLALTKKIPENTTTYIRENMAEKTFIQACSPAWTPTFLNPPLSAQLS